MTTSSQYSEWGHLEIPINSKALPEFEPYEHQRQVWRVLDTWSKRRQGIIALPTGAGKTYTAVHWLLKEVLSGPERRPVLWIAHRAELIQQAAERFAKYVGLATRNDPLVIRCISGEHGKPVTTMLKTADVTLATIQSMSRRLDVVRDFFADNKNCFVVVDEAHHAAARTYREVLSIARKRRKVELLGLTATPTRTVQQEVVHIKKHFPDEIMYQVDLVTLIERKILSRPITRTVKTNINFDRRLGKKDLQHIARFRDFPPSVLKMIGKSTVRNKLIANHYVDNMDEYGKTMVFATDIAHCYSLSETLNKMGVKSGYVISTRPDGPSNKEVIEAFRNNEISVLVSVAMLTEGLDVPSVDTVFLARPTGSEILMRQMVGRGMRGPKAGGKPEVHIVSFADHWERFPDWLDPISLIDPAGAAPVTSHAKGYRGYLVDVPWELISAISELAPDVEPTSVFSSLPIGWYDFPVSVPEQGRASAILVYSHQKEAYDRFIRDTNEGQYTLSGRGGASARYFSDIPDPRPSNQSLESLARYIDDFGQPKYISFADKDHFDPDIVARKNRRKTSKQLLDVADKIFDSTLARECYRDKKRYQDAVLTALRDLLLQETKSIDGPIMISKYRKNKTALPPGSFPLEKIRDAVRKQMKLLKPPPIIRWSKNTLSTCWGFYRESDETIVVNRVLMTSAISRSTVEFLVYHELLHHELGVSVGHGRLFRDLERIYPGATKAECELDTLMEKYYVPSWFN